MCCCALVCTPGVSAVSWAALTREELNEPEEGVRKKSMERFRDACVALGSAPSREGQEGLWCLLA